MKKLFIYLLPMALCCLSLTACFRAGGNADAEEHDTIVVNDTVSMPIVKAPRTTNDGALIVLTDVVPDVILEMRYYSTFNFTGSRVRGYEEPIALLTRRAADSLKVVSDELMAQGYRLKIFDAYRPTRAVQFFMEWGANDDQRMKEYFYPDIPKNQIIPQQYVARRSGHSRGSALDLTIVDMKSGKEVDMGCPFDHFGKASWPTLQPGESAGSFTPISQEQYDHRMILRNAMLKHGFSPDKGEWWHFHLTNEPYPHTYFDHPVRIPAEE